MHFQKTKFRLAFILLVICSMFAMALPADSQNSLAVLLVSAGLTGVMEISC